MTENTTPTTATITHGTDGAPLYEPRIVQADAVRVAELRAAGFTVETGYLEPDAEAALVLERAERDTNRRGFAASVAPLLLLAADTVNPARTLDHAVAAFAASAVTALAAGADRLAVNLVLPLIEDGAADTVQDERAGMALGIAAALLLDVPRDAHAFTDRLAQLLDL